MARKKPRTGVPQVRWGAVERAYRRRLNEVVLAAVELVEKRLFPQLQALADEQRGRLGLRVDSPISEVEQILSSVSLELDDLFPDALLESEVRLQAQEASAVNREQVRSQVKRVKGFDVFLDTPGLADVLDGFTKDNVRLVKSLKRDYLDRIEGSVKRGFRAGLRHEEVAKEIRRETGVVKKRAKLIARDQIASINGELSRSRQTANGIRRFVWRTSGDERVRDEHQALEGQVFSWETGSPEGFPGQPVNCRCYAEPVFE